MCRGADTVSVAGPCCRPFPSGALLAPAASWFLAGSWKLKPLVHSARALWLQPDSVVCKSIWTGTRGWPHMLRGRRRRPHCQRLCVGVTHHPQGPRYAKAMGRGRCHSAHEH